MTRWILLLLAVVALNVSIQAQAPQGIPRSLAQARAANVSDLHYALHFTLLPHAGQTEATESLRFLLKQTNAPLLLDFRDGRVTSLTVNGAPVPPEESNGHLVLAAQHLRIGENALELHFVANVAPSEKAITRFEDHDDGSEYIYTLFVPMDASMAFPCFDQPDLKGRFQLTVTAPAAWTVISNTEPVEKQALATGQSQTVFGETHPISTYLFAFAAGQFVKVHPVQGLPGLYVRQSKARTAESEASAVQQMAADGIGYLANYFAQPFPFPKYDMVLIPGFAYGGMEHAGATFLREESVLFRSAPTETNLLNRDVLVLHELTHQWFGDFTTMRWFDDLWLKEGFAQYMAYQTLATLRPNDEIWKRFYEAIKPAAYAIDETQGTTPIYQDIPNLKDAKSAYGAIVYSKAPGVLKQLAFVLGEDNFRMGLQRYLAAHQYANAEWSDLIAAFESVSGQSLHAWADMWIRHRGMPQVDAAWSCDSGRLKTLTLMQHDVLGSGSLWPISSEVLVSYPDGTSQAVRAQLNNKSGPVKEVIGKPCPAFVFANNRDFAYGLFILDPQSRKYVTEHLETMPDVFKRTLLWGSLWQSVRSASFDPEQYVQLALKNLPRERDEALTASIVGHSETAIHRYVGKQSRDILSAELEEMASQRMTDDANKDLRIVWFRALSGVSEQPAGRNALQALLGGTLQVPGVQLRQQDRWGMVTALIAYNDSHANELLRAEEERDPSGDGKKYAYIAQAARPDAATKQHYFDEYLHHLERPEDWIEESLGTFNYWNQSALTEPFLQPALAALNQIKQQRKIFFLVGWLNAFIVGQQTAMAQQEVHDYLQSNKMDEDLRLKILQAVDELDRTVAIRKQFAAP
jgi:aminopeptidase N